MRYLVAADTGGTFTDLAVYDLLTGETRFGKTLTDYDDLIAGVIRGLEDTEAAIGNAALLKHGTTHVINALLERRGARAALVTTAGFRDVVEIARGNRSVPFDLRYRRTTPLIPRRLRFEVTERIDGQGRIVEPLDLAELEKLVEVLKSNEVEAVAVSFLNAYRNPAHEEQACAFLKERLPGVFITSGSALSREWSEYERTSTASANAFVGSHMAEYIGRFEDRLKELSFKGKLYMMGSNGGVMSAALASELPVAMVESGPVGGCIAAAEYARALNIDKAIAFDMGGTTAKCTLVEGGRFESQSTYFVGGYERGIPIRTPVLDIVEVGAGGGSIAWIDENSRLRVGPRSAGSTPGPIAFSRGGREPTVTDANVVLGRIGSNAFLNGKLTLDVEAAAAAIDRLAEPLRLLDADRTDQVAQGILDLASIAMTGAIKEISIERGRDVRAYTLIVFGGGGPMFGAELARSLRIPQVIVPPNPGAFSSFGMLMADARRNLERTFLQVLSASSVEDARENLRLITDQLTVEMANEFGEGDISFEYEADMRYPSQSHTVRVHLPGELTVAGIRAAFEATYQQRYGHINASLAPEFIVLRVTGRVPTPRPKLESGSPPASVEIAPHGRRSVYFRSARARLETPLYRRDDLPIGFSVAGPAIIEEYSSTTILAPGDSLVVGALGELRIAVQPAGIEVTA
jgi:N-methylhydantoinase A